MPWPPTFLAGFSVSPLWTVSDQSQNVAPTRCLCLRPLVPSISWVISPSPVELHASDSLMTRAEPCCKGLHVHKALSSAQGPASARLKALVILSWYVLVTQIGQGRHPWRVVYHHSLSLLASAVCGRPTHGVQWDSKSKLIIKKPHLNQNILWTEEEQWCSKKANCEEILNTTWNVRELCVCARARARYGSQMIVWRLRPIQCTMGPSVWLPAAAMFSYI